MSAAPAPGQPGIPEAERRRKHVRLRGRRTALADAASGRTGRCVGLAQEGHPLAHALRRTRRPTAGWRIEVFNVSISISHRHLHVVLCGRPQLEVAAHDDAVGVRVEPEPVAGLFGSAEDQRVRTVRVDLETGGR